MKFQTVVEPGGKNATGLPVPEDIITALGGGKRPAVLVTVGTHTYRSTIGTMGGQRLIPLSAENRAAAGVAAGQDVEVTLELDTNPREVNLPDDLAAALTADPPARDFFDRLAVSHRKEWVRWITEAKTPETRTRRLTSTLESLRSGKKTR